MPLALISKVEEGSVAFNAGIRPGHSVLSVDGYELNDIIDWRWYTSEESICLDCLDSNGTPYTVELERTFGQDWGIEFNEALFDGTRQCVNACTFCFMRQLPRDARSSLMLRDDDFRLSFLQGTFVTFTNITEEDEQRIIEQHISPLRFSLHAISPSVRTSIIGKHAQQGIAVAERLLKAGIELHAQIVLMPHTNDKNELEKTLTWAYDHPGILSVGIVPVGYTKHQTVFSESYELMNSARAVIDQIRPFQQRSIEERGSAWVYASDEFYRNAYRDNLLEHLPSAQFYDDFSLFEDGIGIVRSFVDDFEESAQLQQACAQALTHSNTTCYLVCGYAQKEFLAPLIDKSPLAEHVVPLYVKNNYFGGNVDVTGLLCASDIIPALQAIPQQHTGNYFAVVPNIIFNADGITLDGKTLTNMQDEASCPLFMVSCQASKYLQEIASIADNDGGA